jgi:uncharacterized paraquat-inducible protein A
VIRLVCPSCGHVILRVLPLEEAEQIRCPRCQREFSPDEEEYVDPEDD